MIHLEPHRVAAVFPDLTARRFGLKNPRDVFPHRGLTAQDLLGQQGDKTGGFIVLPSSPSFRALQGIGQEKLFLGPGDGHIEQTTLLFQFLLAFTGMGGREPSLRQPDDKNGPPFQPLGRMDRGEHQPFLP